MEKSTIKELLDWVKSTVITCVFVIAMMTFIVSPTRVGGASMMPTYEDGDFVLVNIIGKKISGIERFDVIVFKPPNDGIYIKRVIGLPGDHIAYENDTLYINDEALEEPYLDLHKKQLLDTDTLTQDFTLQSLTDHSTIPEGYLFVLGDNRRNSIDSRYSSVGLVPMEKVIGKTSIRFYPLDSIGIVK
ncbi:signal peptidase I [Lysinibacillus sp. ZYM-1]|uniref:signal peptidase I n=1 Tax=Lysinibacillus sp. ZYM-1 TaxID=1681184 RepID=UPI0006CE7E09|nr:signal peptidase I [Lysinibacillus sp. ZYM-1]KPN95015.1 signal peptidase I [Lysinibacillus sp. ZYM-1]